MPLLRETKQSVHAQHCPQVWRVMLMTGERPIQSHEKDSSSLSTSALAPPWKNWPVKCLFLMQTWTKNGQKLIPFTCSFAHPMIHLFSHSFIHSLIWLFITHSFAHLLICSFNHSFICSFAHSFVHSFAHSFDEWRNGWVINWTNERMNKAMNKWTNEWMNEWVGA